MIGRPPQTVIDIANALNVTRTAVSEQITELISIGYVEQKLVHSGGRGRPRYFFSATDLAMRRIFEGLQDMVVLSAWRSIRKRVGEEMFKEICHDIAADIANHYDRQVVNSIPPNRLQEFVDVLIRNGRLISCEETADGIELRKLNCPFIAMIDESRVVCEIDRLCMELFVGQGTSVVQTESRLDDKACCSFLVKFANPDNKPPTTDV
jgi:predicted ArsR family transcriptional regulator